MHLRLSITNPYFIREISTRNSQSYLGPLEGSEGIAPAYDTFHKLSSFHICHPERSEGPLPTRKCVPGIGVLRFAQDDKSGRDLDLIVDIFNNPLQRRRQRLAPARPLQQTHSFR